MENSTTVYASTVNPTTGHRDTTPVEPNGAILAVLEWHAGTDNTPWSQPCEVAEMGDTIYYRYTHKAE